MGEGDTLTNAGIGALVAIVASGVVGPIAPVVGGVVAGYAEGGDRSDGLRVGALSGLLSLIPYVLIGALVFSVLSLVSLGFVPDLGSMLAAGVVGAILVFVVAVGWALSVVVTAAVGGWIGNYVRTDTDV